MDPEYIIMIVVASLVAGLMLIYFLAASHRQGERHFQGRRLAKYYSSENLAKMEYDVAAYHEEDDQSVGMGSQMTIDEFINRTESGSQKSVSELYTPIEDEGLKELHGNYNPDSDS